jgi:hypothetical protein
MTATCHESINKKSLGSFTLLARCNEFVETPMEAPLDGLHVEVDVRFANATVIGRWPYHISVVSGPC